MRISTIIIAALVVTAPAAARDTYVKSHIRSDGTFVQGHHRTAPNRTTLDNYSTSPNINPYTGKQGTVDPYRPRTQPYQYKPRTYTPPKSNYGYKPKGY